MKSLRNFLKKGAVITYKEHMVVKGKYLYLTDSHIFLRVNMDKIPDPNFSTELSPNEEVWVPLSVVTKIKNGVNIVFKKDNVEISDKKSTIQFLYGNRNREIVSVFEKTLEDTLKNTVISNGLNTNGRNFDTKLLGHFGALSDEFTRDKHGKINLNPNDNYVNFLVTIPDVDVSDFVGMIMPLAK